MLFDKYQDFFTNFSFGCLLTSMICYWTSLTLVDFRRKKTNILKNNFTSFFSSLLKLLSFTLPYFGQITSFSANLIIFLLLSTRWIYHGYFPLSNLYESLLFLSWTLLFLNSIFEYKTKSKLLSAIIIPIVLFIYGFASLTLPLEMRKASPLVPALQSNWLMMHVSLMMLSYATLIIGSLLSILFLFLSNSTEKYKDLLKGIDNWSFRTISLGFPFLTLGIIAGAVWANEAWGSYWSWDPKETWALITWLIFAAYLHARIVKGWEGKKPASLGALGFFVVWICYLGVNFLGQGLHSYGWL